MTSNKDISFRSAFIAFVGRPNSGKSTLLNTILGEDLAIVTPLPQTTRRMMRGIYNGDGYQLVFVDTPGIHRGKHALNKSMYKQSVQIFTDKGVDIVCYLIDLSRSFGEEENAVAAMVAEVKATVCLVFNKMDACRDVPAAITAFLTRYPQLSSAAQVALSAVSSEARQRFLSTILPFVPSGPQYYPDDELSDANLRFFAAEFIRKYIIENTSEEVPHASCVEILEYKEIKGQHLVNAVIHVESDGQKGIIIGKKGAVISRIRKLAEKALSRLTGSPASITCHVKVSPHWRDDKRFLATMGLDVKEDAEE